MNNMCSGSKQQGLTLVELMIAISLGLFLSWGAMQAFLSGKQAYSLQQSLSRIQENARLAQEFIGFDIRNAGDYGCGSGDDFIHGEADILNDVAGCASVDGTEGINMLDNVDDATEYQWAVYGYENGVGAPVFNPVRAAGDVLLVRPTVDIGVLSASIGVPANENVATNGFTLNAAPAAPDRELAVGNVVAVSDCSTAKVFKVGGVAGSVVTPSAADNYCTIVKSPNGGTSSFVQGATVRRIDTVYYYIGSNPNNRLALYRSLNGGVAEELLEGVEDMQIEFGIDNDGVVDANGLGDGTVDVYETADNVTAAEWTGWDWIVPVGPCVPTAPTYATCGHKDTSLVRAVRYSLLLAGQENGVTATAQTYSFPPGAAAQTAGDRRMRQVVTSTVGIRSRLNNF